MNLTPPFFPTLGRLLAAEKHIPYCMFKGQSPGVKEWGYLMLSVGNGNSNSGFQD